MYKYNKSQKKGFLNFRDILDRITQKTNSQPRQYGSGFVLLCPAHNDKKPSLSVSEGKDGKALLHCFVGCDINDICAAIDITVKDLFPKKIGLL